jgi:2-polyprenyl-3-methyl-5-hydroxy-6-metoxy-1,4-benzoquinol methylase
MGQMSAKNAASSKHQEATAIRAELEPSRAASARVTRWGSLESSLISRSSIGLLANLQPLADPCVSEASGVRNEEVNASLPNVAASYDQVWNTWGELDYESPAAFHRRRLVLALVREHARSAGQVLEVGCGQGRLLKKLELELPAAVIHGADVSSVSLRKSRELGSGAELFELDLAADGFELSQAERVARFDLVICSEVLEHLVDDRLALERVARLLTPGGHLILTVPSGPRTRFDTALGHVRHYTAHDLTQRLCDSGFQVERVLAWGFPFHNLYRALIGLGSRVSDSTSGASRLPRRAVTLGYRALAHALKPLYFLNRPYWGPQLFAVARKC